MKPITFEIDETSYINLRDRTLFLFYYLLKTY
eukprot:UN27524